mmetsp:Transcript_6244/g.17876  ORF Transcript_6244/g.17876 Transcript_6244/m.17876 type:complete len:223 (-) Transcript_6244:3-671(-)
MLGDRNRCLRHGAARSATSRPSLRREGVALHDAAVLDEGRGAHPPTARALGLQLLHHVHAFDDLAEDDVLPIEVPRGRRGDEELGPVGVWAGVGHAQEPGLVVRDAELLVREAAAVNGDPAGAVARRRVAALDHEAGDDPVEGRVSEAQRRPLVAPAQLLEIGRGLRHVLAVQAEDDAAGLLAADGHVEEGLRGHRRCGASPEHGAHGGESGGSHVESRKGA